jgi:hypothetical protein
MTPETRSTTVCAHCRRDFSPRRCDRVFCNAACRQAAYRVRKEAKAAEAAAKAAAAERARAAREAEARRIDGLVHSLIG